MSNPNGRPQQPDKNLTLSAVDLAWLAGLLEGEVWFGVQHNNSGTSMTQRVNLAMTDRDVVERAAGLMGGKIETCRRPPFKNIYRIQLSGANARSVMRVVRPLMGRRRSSRIDEIMAISEKHS